MNIGFDAKRAAQNGTGLGNYSRYVISLWEKYAPQQELNLYVPHPKKNQLLKRLPKSDKLHIFYPKSMLERLFPSLWRSWWLTRQLQNDKVDIFHGLSNELPFNIQKAKSVKTIVTVHDLLFLQFPQGYRWIERVIHNIKVKAACRHANSIIAVSKYTKQQIVKCYGINPNKIQVVYQGCDPTFRTKASEQKKEEVRATYQLAAPYILYVGTIEQRKNLMLLAKALKEIHSELQVIAVGRRTAYADQVDNYLKEHQLSHRMRLISNVPFDHLPALYQMASVFVYPSRCEGFGIPILEALCSGTPVVGCTGSCLEEAGGPNSLYVHPDNAQELAQAVNQITSDTSLKEKMIKEGLQYAQLFEDHKLFGDLYNVYRQI